MPSKYVVRNFIQDGYYHVLNRGVEKRIIFLDNQDYQIFLYYLKVYLLPIEKVALLYPDLPFRFYSKNLSDEVNLVAYCLMPNHFHLLLQQKSQDGISKLIKRLTNAYTHYFNEKVNRVGGLMQGTFKAVAVESDEQLIHLSRYIHLNPISAHLCNDLKQYQWSSYFEYIDTKLLSLCKTEPILSYFKSKEDYNQFLKDQADFQKKQADIMHLLLEE